MGSLGPKKYIDLLSDTGLKRALSPDTNAEQLMALLNAILPDSRQIVSLSPLPNDLPGVSALDRTVIYDLSCVDATGRRFIIEIQRLYQKELRRRLLCRTSDFTLFAAGCRAV